MSEEKPKRKTRLKPYVVYLDPTEREDIEIMRYLKTKEKRRRVSSEIREALIVYLAFKNGRLGESQSARPMRPELTYQDIDELPQTAIEAKNTFLKPRR